MGSLEVVMKDAVVSTITSKTSMMSMKGTRLRESIFFILISINPPASFELWGSGIVVHIPFGDDDFTLAH